MFQVVTMWNLSRPDEEMLDRVENIELRGYNPEVFLTGEFARKLSTEEIRPLSVSDIADRYCHTRRDLYFTKGINPPPRNVVSRRRRTWGGVAGHVVESYIRRILEESADQDNSYSSLIEDGRGLNRGFADSNTSQLKKLRGIEQRSEGSEIGDTDWLLRVLDHNGRAELGLKLLHSMITEEESLDIADVETEQRALQIMPNTFQIGINSPATPDFIVPNFRIVGDIKSGKGFKNHFLLTCAGYALAYENQNGKCYNIDWGVIYFVPTRSTSEDFRPLTFAQVYIFPIDNNLRSWFTHRRDEAYDIISKPNAPNLPPEDKREHCPYCRFKDYCIDEGLEL